MKENDTTAADKVRLTRGDIVLILIQVVVALALIGTIPGEGLQFFLIAAAAYLFILGSVIIRSHKSGLNTNDRKWLLFGFIPLSVIATILTVIVWMVKY